MGSTEFNLNRSNLELPAFNVGGHLLPRRRGSRGGGQSGRGDGGKRILEGIRGCAFIAAAAVTNASTLSSHHKSLFSRRRHRRNGSRCVADLVHRSRLLEVVALARAVDAAAG